MILSLPLIALSLIAYNLAIWTGVSFDLELLSLPMISGAVWVLKLGDLLIVLTLVLLFIEILKATRTGGNSLVDHALSTVVFIICIIEFLIFDKAATSLFFFITVVALIDVIAGFSVTIRAARRDFGVGPSAH